MSPLWLLLIVPAAVAVGLGIAVVWLNVIFWNVWR